MVRGRGKKKETWAGKKDEGGGRIIPGGNRRGGNLSRNNELCAIDFLLYQRRRRAACSCSFLSVIARKKGRFADILMNLGGNNDEKFLKWE